VSRAIVVSMTGVRADADHLLWRQTGRRGAQRGGDGKRSVLRRVGWCSRLGVSARLWPRTIFIHGCSRSIRSIMKRCHGRRCRRPDGATRGQLMRRRLRADRRRDYCRRSQSTQNGRNDPIDRRFISLPQPPCQIPSPARSSSKATATPRRAHPMPTATSYTWRPPADYRSHNPIMNSAKPPETSSRHQLARYAPVPAVTPATAIAV
jgi:hypothetical protein